MDKITPIADNYADPEMLATAVDRFFLDPTSRDNPMPMFAQLHKVAPIYKSRAGTWFVTGYDAAQTLLRGDRLSRWEAAQTELAVDAMEDPLARQAMKSSIEMMINRDEPDHGRLRKLVRHVFLPSAVLGWTSRIEQITQTIIDGVANKREFDMIKELAFPLPEMVICDLLGVPHADHALWSQWSHDVVSANRTPAPTGENLRIVQEASINFYNYFKNLIDVRRQNLGDDLMSLMIKAEEDGEKLTVDELIGTAMMLIQAGQETTANLTANGMVILMRHPEFYQQLVDDPSLVPNAVEELLRLDSPAIMTMPRIALEDLSFGGVTIPKGDYVMFSMLASNHDPNVFPEPEKIDFHRANQYKNVAFGIGIHSCIGRQFALLEARTMFRAIMKRLPHLEIAVEPKRAASFTRGYASLIVRNRDVA